MKYVQYFISLLYTQLKQLWNSSLFVLALLWENRAVVSYNIHFLYVYSFAFFTFYGYIMNSQFDQLPDGLIA